VRLLVSFGANVDAVMVLGFTPVMIAAIMGHEEIIKFLIDIGRADIWKKNERKKSALILAINNHHAEVVNILRAALRKQRPSRLPDEAEEMVAAFSEMGLKMAE
jgi:ankyrin repeat protein